MPTAAGRKSDYAKRFIAAAREKSCIFLELRRADLSSIALAQEEAGEGGLGALVVGVRSGRTPMAQTRRHGDAEPKAQPPKSAEVFALPLEFWKKDEEHRKFAICYW
jgi:hypothetical protein